MNIRFKMLIFMVFVGAVTVFASGRNPKSFTPLKFSVTTIDGDATDTLQDTIVVVVYDKMFDFNSVTGIVIVGAAASTKRGFGLDDSAIITIQTSLHSRVFDISSTSFANIPCTLLYASPPNIGISDTLFKRDLRFQVVIFDTLADSALTTTYPITWEFVLKE